MRASYSRREALRALAGLLALPTFESLAPAAWAARQVPRLLYTYIPNGVHLPDWKPKEVGPDFDLTYLLEPLAPYRSHLRVLSGLTQDKARANGDGPGDHARAAAVWLTGVQPLKAPGRVSLGVSADQVAALDLASTTPFKSLQLACERGATEGECDSGYSCAYSCHISWQNESTPSGLEVRPGVVFDALFRAGRRDGDPASLRRLRARRKSVLDYAREEARRVRRELDSADRGRLDEYLSGVRELERRLARFEQEEVREVPDSARQDGVPADYGEHLRAMYDLIVLALATDRTRVVTFLTANEGSGRTFPSLGIHQGHHTLSHHKGEADKQAKLRRIGRFQSEQLAYLLRRLRETPDGPGSLLDAVQLVYGAGIGDGNRHNHDDLPTLLIGGGAGKLGAAGHLSFPAETPMNDLHLALLANMGVECERLGDSSGRRLEL